MYYRKPYAYLHCSNVNWFFVNEPTLFWVVLCSTSGCILNSFLRPAWESPLKWCKSSASNWRIASAHSSRRCWRCHQLVSFASGWHNLHWSIFACLSSWKEEEWTASLQLFGTASLNQTFVITRCSHLWTFIERGLRIKKDRHLVKTVSIWVDQVMFKEKCTPRYLTVCSRDKASPLRRENGSWEEVFWNKRGIKRISPDNDKPLISKTREVVIKPLLVGTFAARIAKHKMIRLLQQSVVTGWEGVSMQGE